MKKSKLRQLAHLLAGVLVLNHGLDAFEKSDLASAAVYLGISVFFLIIAGLHTVIISRFRRADQTLFLLESLALFYSAWQYTRQGNRPLFCFMAVAGIVFFVFAMKSKNDRKKHHLGKRKKMRGTGSSPAQPEPIKLPSQKGLSS